LIPDGVTGIIPWHSSSSHTMAQGLTQPLTEMSTRNISWGVKAASVYGWQPYHLHVPTVLKSRSLNLLEPLGLLWLSYTAFLKHLLHNFYSCIWHTQQDRSRTCNITVRHIWATTTAVGKQ